MSFPRILAAFAVLGLACGGEPPADETARDLSLAPAESVATLSDTAAAGTPAPTGTPATQTATPAAPPPAAPAASPSPSTGLMWPPTPIESLPCRRASPPRASRRSSSTSRPCMTIVYGITCLKELSVSAWRRSRKKPHSRMRSVHSVTGSAAPGPASPWGTKPCGKARSNRS